MEFVTTTDRDVTRDWNDAIERSRDEYRRDPFAASRKLAMNKLKHDYQYGLIDFDEYRDGLAEIRRW